MVIKMKENKLVDLSMDFAVKIMKTCEHIKGHYSINNQLERSGTSIGAKSVKLIMHKVKKTLFRNFR